jgi:hypothetical protein
MSNAWTPAENSIIKDAEARKEILHVGFAKMPSIGSDKIDVLKAAFQKYHSINETGMFYSLYSKDDKYREETNAAIFDTLKNVFDQYFTDYKSSFNLFIIKTANTNEEFFIHQDPSYVDELKYSPLHVWIPLDDITENNGALCFVRKSHRFFSPYRNISFNPPYENIRPFIRQYLEPVFVKAGEMLVFDPRLLHNSLPNNTNETRAVILCGLFPKEAEIVSCYRDEEVKNSPVEFYKQKEDFFITYPDFFETCRMRPVVGEQVGSVPYDYDSINEEQFASICELNGVKPVNYLKPEDVETCRMFGEPVTTL